ncbi:MAG: D-alanyl-D-alanine carboxypeptidase, partial [Muribaculaceae bacterium]|nr:D-alanyl-D-alanine carboxypeptidase [Muribaculaceae bacterium]
MIKTILAILSIGVALSAAALTPQQVVDAFVRNDSMRYATVGVTVLDLEADTLVASNAIDQTMVTASTMKVITS